MPTLFVDLRSAGTLTCQILGRSLIATLLFTLLAAAFANAALADYKPPADIGRPSSGDTTRGSSR